MWDHTGNYPGYTQFPAASPNGRRWVTVSVNEQLSPVQGAPGVFDALRRAEGKAVCTALAEWGNARRADRRRAARRGPKGAVTEGTERAMEAVSFPIEGYDEMNVEEISGHLNDLSVEELQVVRDYEELNEKRQTLLERVDRKIRSA